MCPLCVNSLAGFPTSSATPSYNSKPVQTFSALPLVEFRLTLFTLTPRLHKMEISVVPSQAVVPVKTVLPDSSISGCFVCGAPGLYPYHGAVSTLTAKDFETYVSRLPNKRVQKILLLISVASKAPFSLTFQTRSKSQRILLLLKPPEHPFKVGSTGQRLDETLILRSEKCLL